MKKILLLMIFISLSVVYTITGNKKFSSGETSLIFVESELIFKNYNRDTYEKTEKRYKYSMQSESGIEYILFNNKKYMVLRCDDLFFLYDSNNERVFRGTKFGILHDECIDTFRDMEESSFLINDGIQYTVKNINGYELGKPWIEGEKGYGIKEWISFYALPKERIYISIGFVDYKNPNLYKEYSRPKRLKLYIDDEFIENIELEDTPNFQKIIIPDGKKGVARLEIWDIYEGTKYPMNACINMIVYDKASNE